MRATNVRMCQVGVNNSRRLKSDQQARIRTSFTTCSLHGWRFVSLLGMLLFLPAAIQAAMPLELRVDFGVSNGAIRPLHGINKGSLAAGGMVDVTAALKALGVPFARLHDCHWPNPDVVDIHAVFPNFQADPEDPAGYDFALTDEYLLATIATGAQIIYRLGESIEHTSKRRFVHPPENTPKWAAICLGIIRHYNEGWANGFHHDIRYWEIWNEPDNRPAMWSGTDDDYFRLYRITASAIKKSYPHLKVGGPAVGNNGRFFKGAFQPAAFVTNFLGLCRRESLPLDFFSWHSYTAAPTEPPRRAQAIRRMLDDHGFATTESHLNEWNYLPGNTWNPISRSSPAEARDRFYQEMSGAQSAAFIAATLLGLQEAPVEVCNFFHGELGGFGLFNLNGVPQKNYYALRAFRDLLDTPRRVQTQGSIPGQLILEAGLNLDATSATILVSNFAYPQSEFRLASARLPWRGRTIVETRLVDATHDFDLTGSEISAAPNASLVLRLKSPAIALISLRRAPPR